MSRHLAERVALLDDDERYALDTLLHADEGDKYRAALSLDFEYAPVDMETFLLDPYFMGAFGARLWPDLLDDLIELHEGGSYLEVILTGGAGYGKEYFAKLAAARMLYETSCFRDPAIAFGQGVDSQLAFVNVSVKETHAKNIFFKELRRALDLSPYFKHDFPRDRNVETELRFPKNVWWGPTATTTSSVLGLNLVGGIMDEVNFMPVVERSVSADPRFTGRRRDYAESIYNIIHTRAKTRFAECGLSVGKLFLISSKSYPDTFLEQRIEETVGDPTVFVRDYPTWGPNPKFQGMSTFPVLVGDMNTPSHLVSVEEAEKLEKGGAYVVWIPETYREDFERNVDFHLQEIAGIATLTREPWFSQWDRVVKCLDPDMRHPFTREETTLTDGVELVRDAVCARGPDGKWGPRHNPDAPRWVAVDHGQTRDATGVCVGHIDGFKDVERTDRETERKFVERAPVVRVDAMLRIVPPKRGEIDFQEVRLQVIYALEDAGLPVAAASSDTWQSVEARQALRKRGYKVVAESVDKAEPYQVLKDAFYEGRVLLYKYQPVLRELRQLEWNPRKKMPDHPPNGCFIGTTRMPLLDGTHPMIESLDGKEVWVYSATPDGKIAPGKARGRLTRMAEELVDVVLDSGAVERCTPEHLWMLRDGTYKEAQHLRPGIDRLMPINRQWPVNGGYERVVDSHGTRLLTHHMVVLASGQAISPEELVHHIDGDKTNNVPRNLEVMSKVEHARDLTSWRHKNDPDYVRRLRAGGRVFNLSDYGRRAHSEAFRRTNAAMTNEQKMARARNRAQFRSDITIGDVKRAASDPSVTNPNAAARLLGCGRNVIIRIMRDAGFASWEEFHTRRETGLNHKVRAVLPVRPVEPVPVYDLEVGQWHNFALCSGVFVHNSKDVADALCGVVYCLTKYARRGSREINIEVYGKDH